MATAITPMAFYETVMVKGYETLVDSGTRVDVSTGMVAAARLQALIDSRAGKTSMAEILFKMDRIINAVHSTVPKQLWPEILRKIGGPVTADTPMDEIEDWDDGEDEYGPVESAFLAWRIDNLQATALRTFSPNSSASRRRLFGVTHQSPPGPAVGCGRHAIFRAR